MYLFVCLFFCGCRTENLQSCSDYISFYYWDKGILTECAVTTIEEVKEEAFCADTVLCDSNKVRQFYNYVMWLQPSTEQRCVNLRVVSGIHYNDTTIIASFGENQGIMVDGIRMNDDKRLFDFIEKVLYSEKGYRRLFDKYMETQGFSYNLTPEQIEERWHYFYSTVKNNVIVR